MSDKVDTAIARLREAAQMSETIYEQPLIITTSGGKDSDVVLSLAGKAGINYEVLHSHTTADAPETVRHVREQFRRLEAGGVKCTIAYPTYKGERVSMWSLIPQKLIPPTRLVRYCCDILKEQGGKGRFVTTGIRWSESGSRAQRGMFEAQHHDKAKRLILNNDNDESRLLFETCQLKAKRVCNPIIDWTDADVWTYLRTEHVETNPLYKCGFNRVGCIGCPMARTTGRQFEFARYPKYKDMYIAAFGRMLDVRRARAIDTEWRDAEEVYHWWMEDDHIDGQMELDLIAKSSNGGTQTHPI